MLQVASQATEPLMYADRRTVVARAHQATGQRRVALIAERLPAIRTDLHRTFCCPA